MKKTIKKEVTLCDNCKVEVPYATKCLTCGVEFCYDCRTKFGVEYHAYVYCSGSGDGFYCHTCDNKNEEKGKDKLHTAYRNINRVRKWIAEREIENKAMKEKVEAEIQALF